ncbi:MAG TPA: phosphatidylserine/phosphatidylglycerophosphate/cardiolipin synthase family protein [Polyangiaceae bacterium]|nr:phosphatidylserine/phosphatidylglycerophosphate/cardiolipin synthase family protein [Polyangiaceae bacterium]
MPRNRAKLLVDGHRILPALLRDLGAAQRNIHVSIFLFFRDPIGLQVAEVLAERARAGVKVRILLNMKKTAMGDPFSTGEKRMMKHDPNVDYDPLDVEPLCEALTRAGAEVIDTDIDYDRIIPVADPRLESLAARIRESIDVDVLHIDHRKVIVIDGNVAYAGGANIGAQYLFHVPFDPKLDARAEGRQRKLAGQDEPWWKWHDSLTRFQGPIISAIDEEFHARWLLDGGQPFTLEPPLELPHDRATDSAVAGDELESAKVYTNAPDSQPNAVRELYLRLIAAAERSIFIENPYLYHPAIVDALCAAKAKRPDLSVVLVLPSETHNDNSFAQDAQQHNYPRLLAAGVEIYEYLNHFNHLKLAVFDERFSIHGSTNLNYRSLEDDKDFELVVCIDDRAFAAQNLREVRDVDVRHAHRFTGREIAGMSSAALRVRVRHPWTRFMLWRRVL